MRVSLVRPTVAGAAGSMGPARAIDVPQAATSGDRAQRAAARPLPPHASPPAAGLRHPEPGRDARAGPEGRATALVTPVQSDLWMLAAAAPGPEEPGVDTLPRPEPADPVAGPVQDAPSAGSGNAGGPGTGPTSTAQGAGREAEGVGAGGQAAAAGAPSAASLLAALSQRLAWSAERCSPATLVHLARRAIPGVPLHFCLDAAGRPSGVGLLGTTGSDQLDRAARDCVVPGALPLPPAPGCYTVEVRFPTRG